MVWVETPTNPMLKIVDLARIAAIAKERHLISVVDNTFATPILQRPLEQGFDIVLHFPAELDARFLSELLPGGHRVERGFSELSVGLLFQNH